MATRLEIGEAVAEPESPQNYTWQIVDRHTDRSGWNPKVSRFFDYWRAIAPEGRLPGRQHFDPLAIRQMMPRIWILDVVRGHAGYSYRYRYRLVGTRQVEIFGRELTGEWMDEAHPHLVQRPEIMARYRYMGEHGVPTYRRGHISFVREREFSVTENCQVPLARDGVTVDMIVAFAVLYRENGTEN
jgi:hypothetical protein